MGNLHSVKKKVERHYHEEKISSNPGEIASASKIILPGVGHFGKAMQQLHKLGITAALQEAVLHRKKPVLGICLGLQLMTMYSEEGDVPGLGWIDAHTVRFKVKDKLQHKVPHIGWNDTSNKKNDPLIQSLPDGSQYYFMHAYHLESTVQEQVLQHTTFEYPFVSAVSRNNIYGVQYHPEKSHAVGELLLKNFILNCHSEA